MLMTMKFGFVGGRRAVAAGCAFQPAERGEKFVRLRERLRLVRLLVEEAMRCAGIDVRIAADARGFHRGLELAQHRHTDELVRVAEENAGRRRGLGDVVRGRKLAEPLADALVAPLAGAVVEDGIEQHQRVRLAGNFHVVRRVIESVHESP